MKPSISSDAGSRWLMVIVLLVVAFGIVLLLTDNFGAGSAPGRNVFLDALPDAPRTAAGAA